MESVTRHFVPSHKMRATPPHGFSQRKTSFRLSIPDIFCTSRIFRWRPRRNWSQVNFLTEISRDPGSVFLPCETQTKIYLRPSIPDVKHADALLHGGHGGNRTRAISVLQTAAFPLRHVACSPRVLRYFTSLNALAHIRVGKKGNSRYRVEPCLCF